ncbi:MAG: hypothetical protein MI923_08000 [Phycisphaerales bacterium]|nr:hypothetical protein [Phycisphaerales bacterium]
MLGRTSSEPSGMCGCRFAGDRSGRLGVAARAGRPHKKHDFQRNQVAPP